MKKRIVSSLLIAAFVVSTVVGCGNNAGTASNENAGGNAPAAENTEGDASAAESTQTSSVKSNFEEFDPLEVVEPEGDAKDWTWEQMLASSKALAEASSPEAPEITYTGEPFVLGLSTSNSDEDAQGVNLHYFADRLNELSGGKIQGTVYANGQVSSAADLVPTIQSGGIEGGSVIMSAAETVNTLEGVFGIPFLLYADDWETQRELSYRCSTDPMIEGLIQAEAEKAGLVRLCDSQNSAGGLLFENNVRPVTTVGEAEGLKIRTTGGSTFELLMENFGCANTIIANTELTMALSQGICDGVSSSIDYLYSSGATCKYVTMPFIYEFVNPVYVSKDWYDALPDDLKAAVDQAADDTAKMMYAYGLLNTRKVLALVEEEAEISYLNMDDPDTAAVVSNILNTGIENKVAQGGEAAQQIIDRINEIKAEMGIESVGE